MIHEHAQKLSNPRPAGLSEVIKLGADPSGQERSTVLRFPGPFDNQRVLAKIASDGTGAVSESLRNGPFDPAAKRIFDVVVAAFLLLLLLPGLLLIALGIKLTSPGPVLFRQLRYGRQNQLFEIFKFRTMFVDRADPSGVTQVRPSDPSVTPFGRLLRRSNFDELPQLLNVVRGDMSIVGPRPHVPGMLAGGMLYEVVVAKYFARHQMRPGLTGYAQVKGYRGSTEDTNSAIARIEHDLAYLANWSFSRDCRIVLETIWTELIAGGNGI